VEFSTEWFREVDVESIWKPTVTVAAVAARDGVFLIVEEETELGRLFNQPAGHLEPHESLLEGVVRETLEETGYSFRPQALVGIYRWRHPRRPETYLRFAFCGEVVGHDQERALDEGIVCAHWLTYQQISGTREHHRSPLVMRCIDDYLAGKRFSLDVLTHYD
jgi:8-oxo-dGTP pyrophosphatase MutT (NUDIX family)